MNRVGRMAHPEHSGTQEDGGHYKRVTDTVADVTVRFEKISTRGSG